jgi:protein-S-isoprenylcysteine O-methyltransferase Ste14
MYLFYIVWSLWFLSEILLNLLFRSGASDSKDKDKGSIRVLWRSIGIANTIGIASVFFLHLPIGRGPLVPYIGLSVILIGMAFRLFAIWSLGKFFTVDVTIRKDHKIKNDGVYRYMRHPTYSGMLLTFLGFGLSLNNWASLFIIIIPVTWATLYRINIEEKALLEQFGKAYEEYIKKTRRLIPWIY